MLFIFSFDQLTKSKPGLILVSIIGFFVVSSIALAVTLVFALEGNFDNHEGKIYIIWSKHLLMQ